MEGTRPSKINESICRRPPEEHQKPPTPPRQDQSATLPGAVDVAANHKVLFLNMYTPLVGSGELDHKSRHVVPRPQSQRTSDQLRAALGGRLAPL